MELVLGFIVAFIIAAIVGVVYTCQDNKLRKAEAELNGSCRISGHILYVDKQSSAFSTVLTLQAYKVNTVQYVPEKIHVGAATVGGVTTGGAYKTGGYNNVKSTNVDRYKLIYKTIGANQSVTEHEVQDIVLSDTLAEKACNSGIKQYMKGNNRIEIVEVVRGSTYVAALMESGQTAAAVSQLSIEKAAGYPSKEKCEDILAWLCGK